MTVRKERVLPAKVDHGSSEFPFCFSWSQTSYPAINHSSRSSWIDYNSTRSAANYNFRADDPRVVCVQDAFTGHYRVKRRI